MIYHKVCVATNRFWLWFINNSNITDLSSHLRCYFHTQLVFIHGLATFPFSMFKNCCASPPPAILFPLILSLILGCSHGTAARSDLINSSHLRLTNKSHTFSTLSLNFKNSIRHLLFSLPLLTVATVPFYFFFSTLANTLQRHHTPLSSKLRVNPCLNWRLTGFLCSSYRP